MQDLLFYGACSVNRRSGSVIESNARAIAIACGSLHYQSEDDGATFLGGAS